MGAINFDQPSGGRVSSPSTALSVVNSGAGEAIHADTNGTFNYLQQKNDI